MKTKRTALALVTLGTVLTNHNGGAIVTADTNHTTQPPSDESQTRNLKEALYWQQRSIIAADTAVRLFGTLDGVLFSIAAHQYAARAKYYRELADAAQTGGAS